MGRAQDAAGPIFSNELFAFFRELAENNRKEWFVANKDRYDRLVREPSIAFVRAVAPGIAKISAELCADDRGNGGSVMRIYRDIRFARDKSPYKTHQGIDFFHAKAGDREGGLPGFYLHLDPKGSFVGAGMWGANPADLAKIRTAIAAKGAAWKKARGKGLDDHGEQLKRVP